MVSIFATGMMQKNRYRVRTLQGRIHTGFHGVTEIGQIIISLKNIFFPENGLDNFSPSNFQALETIIIFRRFVRLHPRRMELANTLSKLYDSETQVWGL